MLVTFLNVIVNYIPYMWEVEIDYQVKFTVSYVVGKQNFAYLIVISLHTAWAAVRNPQ